MATQTDSDRSEDQPEGERPTTRPAATVRDTETTTRRGLLAGIGTLGVGIVGAMADRTRAQAADGTATGGGREPSTPRDHQGGLEEFVDGLLADHLGDVTPGATVAVVRDGKQLLAKGYGRADVETDTPVRADETAFRVGSVGKLATWTAVMQSVEAGTVTLDEDVTAYLEDSPVEIPDAFDDPVTLRHLGTHTAGFESTIDPGVVSDANELTSLEAVLAEQRPARVRPPGAAVGYSNYGAALAGHVVAEANDTTFEEYVRANVLEPLGMTHSTFAQPVPDDHPGTLAAGHTRDGGRFAVADDVFVGMRPAGSLSATAPDMARFASAHLGAGAVDDARILERETAHRMHAVHHVRHPAVNNWRYGFYEYGPPDANLLAHSGATVYVSSLLVLAPDHDVGVFLSYNSDAAEPAHLEHVVDAVLDWFGARPATARPEPTDAPGTQERAETVAGEYSTTMLPERGPLHVADVLAHLSVEARPDGRLVADGREWVETDPYVFREVGGRDVLAFEVADGEVDVVNRSRAQQGVHEPVPVHERQVVTGGVVAASLSGFALSLLGKGGHGAWRRWRASRGCGREPDE